MQTRSVQVQALAVQLQQVLVQTPSARVESCLVCEPQLAAVQLPEDEFVRALEWAVFPAGSGIVRVDDALCVDAVQWRRAHVCSMYHYS